jgi:hypothetical protein
MEAEQEFDEELFRTDTSGGTEKTVVVSFHLSREDAAILQQLVNALPKSEYGHRLSKSELIRQLLMPYVASLKLAKEGKAWQGALEFGNQFVKLNKALRIEARKTEQEEIDFNPTVSAIPDSP